MTTALEISFHALVNEHRKILHKVCHSYCRDPASRDDLAQEIMIQLWRSFNRFDGRCRFSTWMYRIALNVAISFYRSESTRTRNLISGDLRLLETAEETTSQPEGIRLIYDLIETLDPLNKALILLYLDGHTYGESADVLGITETNVATRISRLKSRMKRELNQNYTAVPQKKI